MDPTKNLPPILDVTGNSLPHPITHTSVKSCLKHPNHYFPKIIHSHLLQSTTTMFHKAKTLLQNLLNFPKNLKPCKKPKPKPPTQPSMAAPLQLRHVFNLIDGDGDGKISPLELKHLLLRLGHDGDGDAAAAAAAEGMIREMDVDGDGLVDLDEFMRVFGNDPIGVLRESEIAEAFRVFDADDNGFISAEELHSVMARLGLTGGNCTVRDCREMIKGVDRDGDGFVSLEEFKCMMTSGLI